MKRRFYTLLLIGFLLSLADVQAQREATPKVGEGTSTFLLRRSRVPKKYCDDFVELNKVELGKGNVLKLGVAYTIPPIKRSVATDKETPARKQFPKVSKIGTALYKPLFDKQPVNVKVTPSRLADTCFYVVSRRGGPDLGAIERVGKHKPYEDEYAYDITLRLAQNLMREGAEVHIIIQDARDGVRSGAHLSNSRRKTCMGDPIPSNQVQYLQQRCDKIGVPYRKGCQNYTYCRTISTHADGRSKKEQTDVFFYHSNKKAESKWLTNSMKDTSESKYGKHQSNRGFSGTMSGRNLCVPSHTVPASVFVELENIQNVFDRRRPVMDSNRQALAKWSTEDFLKDFKGRK